MCLEMVAKWALAILSLSCFEGVFAQYNLSPAQPSENYHLLDSVALSESAVSISIGTAGSSGFVWGRNPIPYPAEFDYEMEFDVTGPELSTLTNGFAIWFTTESFPNLDSSSNLFGYKDRFDGLAVFFANFDRTGQLRPSISAAFNDGTRAWNMETETPSNDGIYFATRNSGENVQFRVSFTEEQILGLVKTQKSTTWTQCFKLPAVGFRVATDTLFVGLSSSNKPSASTDPNEPEGDMISFRSVDVTGKFALPNSGPSVVKTTKKSSQGTQQIIGAQPPVQENQQVAAATPPVYPSSMELSQDDRRSIQRLENSIVDVQQQIEKFSETAQQDVKEQLLLVESLAKEVASLQTAVATIQKSVQIVVRKVERSKDSNELRSLAQSFEQGVAAIKEQSSFSWWLVGALVACFCLLAIFIWRKVKELEKRHIL